MSISDYKRQGRQALTCNWANAVAVSFVADIIIGVFYNYESLISTLLKLICATDVLKGFTAFASRFHTVKLIAFIIVYFFILSALEVGKAYYYLKLHKGESAGFKDLFWGFKVWNTALAAQVMVTLICIGGYLLFIVPSIIFFYNYAMTFYVLADNPSLSASEAMRRSKSMMRGNRMRLFVLKISFFGWFLLTIASLGIGFLWYYPYMEASTAAFYNDIAGNKRSK